MHNVNKLLIIIFVTTFLFSGNMFAKKHIPHEDDKNEVVNLVDAIKIKIDAVLKKNKGNKRHINNSYLLTQTDKNTLNSLANNTLYRVEKLAQQKKTLEYNQNVTRPRQENTSILLHNILKILYKNKSPPIKIAENSNKILDFPELLNINTDNLVKKLIAINASLDRILKDKINLGDVYREIKFASIYASFILETQTSLRRIPIIKHEDSDSKEEPYKYVSQIFHSLDQVASNTNGTSFIHISSDKDNIKLTQGELFDLSTILHDEMQRLYAAHINNELPIDYIHQSSVSATDILHKLRLLALQTQNLQKTAV